MTHDILQSDIELATRLRDEQRPDEQIISALVHRGIDPAKAAQLVDDLRNRRRPSVQAQLPAEFSLPRRSKPRSAAQENQNGQPPRSSPPPPRNQPPARPATRDPKKAPASAAIPVVPPPPARPAEPGRKSSLLSWLMGAVPVVLATLAISVFVYQRYHVRTQPGEATGPKAASKMPVGVSGKAPLKASAIPAGEPASLVLELQPDGLHIGGSLVTAENVLPVMAKVLGAPTRMDAVGPSGTTVYAYDQHGLLIYEQKPGGTNSVVLDFEASGGNNGTTAPFAGALRIEDQVIGPDTDVQALRAIKSLGLKHPGTSDSIWGGRYYNLDLVFAYLRSPRHLSLIEIDLR